MQITKKLDESYIQKVMHDYILDLKEQKNTKVNKILQK